MILHCSHLQEALGLSRRGALKLARAMGAEMIERNGRADCATTDKALELWLTAKTCRVLSEAISKDPTTRAAIEMTLAAQLEHGPTLEKLRAA